MPLPRPPISTMTDFVVFVFVSIVAIILAVATIGVLIDGIIDPKGDRSAVIGMLADIVTTLIGALVGFIAGKGSGRSEVHDEMTALAAQQQQRPPDTAAPVAPAPPPKELS